MGGEDREFVAPEARDQIAVADGPEQALGDEDQQLAARRVPMHVVDRLEPVEIEQEHRMRGALPAGGSIAAASASSNRRRLGSPVSTS